jgi:hypothetical protein
MFYVAPILTQFLYYCNIHKYFERICNYIQQYHWHNTINRLYDTNRLYSSYTSYIPWCSRNLPSNMFKNNLFYNICAVNNPRNYYGYIFDETSIQNSFVRACWHSEKKYGWSGCINHKISVDDCYYCKCVAQYASCEECSYCGWNNSRQLILYGMSPDNTASQISICMLKRYCRIKFTYVRSDMYVKLHIGMCIPSNKYKICSIHLKGNVKLFGINYGFYTCEKVLIESDIFKRMSSKRTKVSKNIIAKDTIPGIKFEVNKKRFRYKRRN